MHVTIISYNRIRKKVVVKMSKKFIVIMISLVLLITLSSCNASKNESTDSQSEDETKTEIEKTFTLDELSQYNGKDGNSAYIAFKGIVYDVSDVKKWKDGEHNGMSAGSDLTDMIGKSPHGEKVFESLPIVGKLE